MLCARNKMERRESKGNRRRYLSTYLIVRREGETENDVSTMYVP